MGGAAAGLPDEFLLRAARFVWGLGRGRGSVCLGSARRRPRLAAVYGRAWDRYRGIWLVLGVGRAVRLGDLSLWPLGLLSRCRLVLGARNALGAGVGGLARIERLPRLGA